MEFQEVIQFWFQEIEPRCWFEKNSQFDRRLKARFLPTYEKVMAGQTSEWRFFPEGALAEVLVLDQFSRNMFRDTAQAFAGDSLALGLAQDAVERGDDQKLELRKRNFLYMPYMHSEDAEVHQRAIELFSQKGLEDSLKYELLHKGIIDRFGRYPHRNLILGRTSTPEEIAFLKEPGSSF